MSLKQISPEKRIMFLKLFTQRLIINSIREKLTQDKIQTEKLTQKFIQPNITPEQALSLLTIFCTATERYTEK